MLNQNLNEELNEIENFNDLTTDINVLSVGKKTKIIGEPIYTNERKFQVSILIFLNSLLSVQCWFNRQKRYGPNTVSPCQVLRELKLETASTAAVSMEIHVNCGSKHGKK